MLTLNTFATWCEELIHQKRPWCWERLKTGGEGDNRGRDGWMASLTQQTWVWTNSRRWWRTGEPGGLPSTGLHRVGHNWSDLAATAAVKAMVFPLVTYGCESWTVKKAESWRIDAFELWCWRIRLRVPWTARRSNQSILKEISPEYSVEGLMLKLKLQYFGHPIWRTDSWKRPWC